ncbi:MAG: hypothetical protein ACRC20_13875 [Segniliparus sp.]|uniref:hypothetical protein n=1 Tax=Segniliparus sp. TaxID=2804064 RepID=UPI003F40BBD0
MRSIFVLACLVGSCACAGLATAAPQETGGDGQWCPGQPWPMTWGVNWDRAHCHGVAKPNDANTDLHPTPTPDPGPPSDYPPGQYPPNYPWGEHYPYNANPYYGSPYRGQHN